MIPVVKPAVLDSLVAQAKGKNHNLEYSGEIFDEIKLKNPVLLDFATQMYKNAVGYENLTRQEIGGLVFFAVVTAIKALYVQEEVNNMEYV